MFEGAEPITICDKLLLLFLGQLEAVSLWKSPDVAFDGLIEDYRLDLIELGKVGIHYDLQSSDSEDAALDGVRSVDVERCGADGLYVAGLLCHIY